MFAEQLLEVRTRKFETPMALARPVAAIFSSDFQASTKVSFSGVGQWMRYRST